MLFGLITLEKQIPIQSLWGSDIPIQDASCMEAAGTMHIRTISQRLYSRDLDSVVIEKRSDGLFYTSARFSLRGVTLMVPVDQDVKTWQEEIENAKAKYVIYFGSTQPHRVLPH